MKPKMGEVGHKKTRFGPDDFVHGREEIGQVTMAHHHALRFASRTGGVNDVSEAL